MGEMFMEKSIRKILCHVVSAFLALSCLCACGSTESSASSGGGTVLGSSGKEIRIVSGSENKELEPVLAEYAEKNHVKIVMTYEGSLDIMHDLEQDDIPYDAVWPASSVWLNAGDAQHRVKHVESVSINPVVFGIRKSLAEELGFTGREVSVKEILAAIQAGKLRFCMTSATQSNSGASAYIGFLYALLGNPDVITKEDLNNTEMQEQLRELLSGIDRSSGSSDWLKEMFVKGSYDAMVNYECLMISADNALVQQGKEPLYVVYPYDGLSIADSPLGYVDHGDDKAEERFLALQEYLLSADVQSKIQRTGRRSSYTGINEENKDVFKEEWGLQPDRVISPFRMPDADTLMAALDLYQTQLRKPSLTAYCLDFSGSMKGEGEKQLKAAMEQLLIQEYAEKNYLQASDEDVTIIIPFSSGVIYDISAEGNGSGLEDLYKQIDSTKAGGGTDMYSAIEQALSDMAQYDDSRNKAIVVMTDGMSEDHFDALQEMINASGNDIPVFSILYGDADESQLQEIADLTNARVFDGRDSLTDAFRKVKGYN